VQLPDATRRSFDCRRPQLTCIVGRTPEIYCYRRDSSVTYQFLDSYRDELFAAYKRYNIVSLQDSVVEFDGFNSLQFVYRCCSRAREDEAIKLKLDPLIHDLINSTSVDVKIALGNLFLYRDAGLFDFASERIATAQYEASRYEPTFAERRFFFYLSVCWEKLYNFWDRIGDLLWLCLELPLKENRVYFSRVIQELEQRCGRSEHFQPLRQFHETNYQEITNRARIDVVHYQQTDTAFFWDWLTNSTDREGIHRIHEWRDSQPDVLKLQNQLALIGFGHAGRLIAECT